MSTKPRYLPWEFESLDNNHTSQIIPELDLLKTVVEQNDWHNDDAFQQSWRLFEWVRQLPTSLLEIMSIPEATLQELLDTAVGYYTKQALLAFAALIHDIGKAETFQQHPDGTTRCPDHEAAGARMAPTLCARFDFTVKEAEFITTLVGAHGEPYALFKKIAALPAPQQQGQIGRFEEKHASHLLPLLLLAWGDLVTSHLQTIRPDKYAAVFNFYRQWLRKILPGED